MIDLLNNKIILFILIFFSLSGFSEVNDTGTVIFSYRYGYVSGIFRDILNTIDLTGDSTNSSINFRWSDDIRVHKYFGVGCNEDTGSSYPIDGYFYAEGFNTLLGRIDSAGLMIDTSDLVVKVMGGQFSDYDWTCYDLETFYSECIMNDSTDTCRIILELYDSSKVCTTVTTRIIESDSTSDPPEISYDFTELFKYALRHNLLDVNRKISMSIRLVQQCDNTFYVEFGSAINADETTGDMSKFPELFFHTRLVQSTSITNKSFPVKCNNFTLSSPPFKQMKTIRFSLSEDDFVTMGLYDFKGRCVKTLLQEKRKSGDHTVSFNGNSLPCGMYICALNIGNVRHLKTFYLIT